MHSCLINLKLYKIIYRFVDNIQIGYGLYVPQYINQ